MHNLKAIRKNPNAYKLALSRKKDFSSEIFQSILNLDETLRVSTTELNKLQAERNALSKQIPQSSGEYRSKLVKQAKDLSEKVKSQARQNSRLNEILKKKLSFLPNIAQENVPSGQSEEDNVVVSTYGQKPVYGFPISDHLTVAKKLDLLDFERGTKITGSGFPVWKGFGARLERALISFMLDQHTQEGYEEILPPLLVNPESAFGTGQLPKSEEEMYHIPKDNLYLIPTAEVPVTNLHRDEIIPHKILPIKYTSYTPCFRREAGGHGKKTKGFLRVHQFNKVELVQITKGDIKISSQALLNIRNQAEIILQKLGLHYRVIELCDKDLSFAASKCFDIEVWAPAEERYLEASSCSNFLDFQARRLNLRYRDKDKKAKFCHTLNGSGLATSRVLVALLETYQTPDGGLNIPEVLVPYMGYDWIGSNASGSR